jgi:histidyl-tRNA synthetase
MKIQPVRGTHDLYGSQIDKFNKVKSAINDYAKIYDFDEIVTPIFESTALFQKPLGENSDVVLKEMYTFSDKNNSSITLRPEYTTPMLRAAISNNFLEKIPKKIYGVGPMFRRERPQKGRYRQFYQTNFEVLGLKDVLADVELINLANDILKNILPNKKIKLHINSLGDQNTLRLYKSELSVYFEKYKNDLSEESQRKIFKNPIRILDSKSAIDNKIIKEAPTISSYHSKDAKQRFFDIQNLLASSSI